GPDARGGGARPGGEPRPDVLARDLPHPHARHPRRRPAGVHALARRLRDHVLQRRRRHDHAAAVRLRDAQAARAARDQRDLDADDRGVDRAGRRLAAAAAARVRRLTRRGRADASPGSGPRGSLRARPRASPARRAGAAPPRLAPAAPAGGAGREGRGRAAAAADADRGGRRAILSHPPPGRHPPNCPARRRGRWLAESVADTAVRDVELTRSLARGDEAALRQLYERHGGLVLALATRMLGSREEAEEVLHDTFYRLWQNAHRFDPERAAVRTYLYALARNLCLSRLRARRSRPVAADLDEHHVAYQVAMSADPDPVPALMAARAL